MPWSRAASKPQKVIDTAVAGEVIRNLTTWTDVDASRVAFAVGNALFAACFIGRKAIFVLWLAFLAAFLKAPMNTGELQEYVTGLKEWAADLHIGDALASAKDGIADAVAMVRERIAAARGRGVGGSPIYDSE